MDPDFVGPDLDKKCLHILLADDTSRQYQTVDAISANSDMQITGNA